MKNCFLFIKSGCIVVYFYFNENNYFNLQLYNKNLNFIDL